MCIPSILLSFLPDYCHSFQIIVIPSRLVSFLPNIVIPSKLLPFQIFVILNSSSTLPYPKGEKNGHRRWPFMRVFVKITHECIQNFKTKQTHMFEKWFLLTLLLLCDLNWILWQKKISNCIKFMNIRTIWKKNIKMAVILMDLQHTEIFLRFILLSNVIHGVS
jgi:hypothetical protein